MVLYSEKCCHRVHGAVREQACSTMGPLEILIASSHQRACFCNGNINTVIEGRDAQSPIRLGGMGVRAHRATLEGQTQASADPPLIRKELDGSVQYSLISRGTGCSKLASRAYIATTGPPPAVDTPLGRAGGGASRILGLRDRREGSATRAKRLRFDAHRAQGVQPLSCHVQHRKINNQCRTHSSTSSPSGPRIRQLQAGTACS